MLPYVLAIAVGLSSLILFLTAFLLPDIHRQDDFFWSAIGLFYALVLWFCATSITGGLLLGQVAAVALLTSYNWQTFKLRKAIAHPEQQANLDSFSVVNSVKSLLSGKGKVKPQPPSPPVTITEKEPILPNQAEVATASSPTEETSSSTPQNNEPILSEEPFVIETTSEPKTQETSTQSSTPSLVAAKKPGLFSNLFNFGKKKTASTTPTTKNTNSVATTKLDELLDEEFEAETTSTEVTVTIAETTSTPESETTQIETISIKSSEEGSPTVETEEILVETTPIEPSSESTPLAPAEIVDIIDTEIEPDTAETTNWDEEDVKSNPRDSVETITVTEIQKSEATIDSNQTTESVLPKQDSDRQKDLNIDEFLKEMEQKKENT
ncbi:MAG: hypothetical protein Kow0049_08720 [Stanieria sp.]